MKYEVGDRVSPTEGYWAGHYGRITQVGDKGWYKLQMEHPEGSLGTPWVKEENLEPVS